MEERLSNAGLFGKYTPIEVTDEMLESLGIKTKNANGEYRKFEEVIAEIKEKKISF